MMESTHHTSILTESFNSVAMQEQEQEQQQQTSMASHHTETAPAAPAPADTEAETTAIDTNVSASVDESMEDVSTCTNETMNQIKVPSSTKEKQLKERCRRLQPKNNNEVNVPSVPSNASNNSCPPIHNKDSEQQSQGQNVHPEAAITTTVLVAEIPSPGTTKTAKEMEVEMEVEMATSTTSSNSIVSNKTSSIHTSTSTAESAAAAAAAAEAEAAVSKLSQSREENWEHMFKELAKYKEETGHCLVPKVFPENKSLSHWVYRQRSLFMTRQRKGEKKNTLTPDRVERLRELGFIFRARSTKEQTKFESQRRKPTSDANWMRNFELLKDFKKEMGHCLVPKVYKKNQTFASWVYTQRHLYKKRQDGKTNLLTDERISTLNSIEFVWNAKKDKQWQDKDRNRKIEKVKDLWEKYFGELVQFKESYGHTLVPKIFKENQSLSSWVFRQRKHYRLREEGKAHSMSDQRLQRLQDINFQFRVRGSSNKKKNVLSEAEESSDSSSIDNNSSPSKQIKDFTTDNKTNSDADLSVLNRIENNTPTEAVGTPMIG